jgi:chromosome segregation ATPase
MLGFLLVSMYELKQFLQIVLWIAIPGTVIAFLVTTFFHYKRKKKSAEGAEPAYMEGGGFHTVVAAEANGNNQVPDWLSSGTNPDNQPLIKKYEQEVRRYRENYATLEQDFRELEGKYSDLLNKAYSTEKQNDDANSHLQLEINGYKLKVTQLQQALETAQANARLVQSEQQVPEALVQSQQQVQQLQETVQQLQERLRTQQDHKDKNAAEITRLENLLKNMEYSAKTAQSESDELQRYYAKQVDELGMQFKNEKTDLAVQLQQLQKTVQQLKDENTALQQKVQAGGEQKHGNYEQQIKELQQLLTKAEEEKTTLKIKITDQQYLQDVLQEKKLQIEFLQNQLEQRIRTFREIEKEAADKTMQVQQAQTYKENFEREMHALREEMQQQREEVAAWQQAVERSREEIRQHQDNLRSKTGHIENLERNLHEVQQQQAVLQLVLDDKQNMITSLQESLNREQHKTKDLEGKLITNNQLLSKIYGDLSKSLSNPPAATQQNGTKLNGSGNNGSNGHMVNGNGFNLAKEQH